MTETPKKNPEKKETVDDNDRKFTLPTIDAQFLADHSARSYLLVTDWIETNEADETKVAYKKFNDGSVEILLIAKVSDGDNRTAQKTPISEDEYKRYLGHTTVHVEKTRFEFEFVQDDTAFAMKYDEFTDSALRVLEVGAQTPADRTSFRPSAFPYPLKEVSDDPSFTGFRVATHI